MTIRVSLCMIARDEEEMLPGCLASLGSAVDEVVLVDTGSSDSTRAIARAAGARVFDLPWTDDFSAPRNLALSKATGDFVLVLDADERLGPGSDRRLRQALETDSFDYAMIRLHNASRIDASLGSVLDGEARLGPPHPLPRVLRRTPDLRYNGVIHESVSDWVSERKARLGRLPVDVVHLGAVPDIRLQRGKQERNFRLLRRRCALEPDSITPLGSLALELIGQGNWGEAGEMARRGWDLLDRQPADRSVLRLAVARAIVSVETGFPEQALEAVAIAERKEGPEPDLFYLRGRALCRMALRASRSKRRRLLSQAELAFRSALELAGREGMRQYVAGASTWASWNGLGEIMLCREKPSLSLQAFDEALRYSPRSPDARLGQVEGLLDCCRAEEALRRVERLLDESPDGWVLAAEAARALGAEDDARFLAEQAKIRQRAGFRAPHRALRLSKLAADFGFPPPDLQTVIAIARDFELHQLAA